MAPTAKPPQPPHSQPPPQAQSPTRPEDGMPSAAELYQIAAKSLQTGALTGAAGLAIGAGGGIMRGAPPALFAAFAGLQWFALGSSYMASRSLLWHAWGGEQNLSQADRIKSSAAAGGVSGMIGGMVRGPRNILPGMLVLSLLGGGATFVSQQLQNRPQPKEKTSWLASEWSPLRPLSGKEYESILEEKILKLDAEISIIEENIAAIKASSKTTAMSGEGPSASKKQ
ncbi:uncharacterized protein BCR38DRAFT_86036 [Pseudomassariella vexata]|uniref:Uncharacterized protein n=1 Tax=Pseudomassariella vexata TaxID=1141098 RepID=A0A1Y2ED29_9PEZI|nr:uncharacterized protein BCR38DRAFT_86036 [Pseudomassariella vexata]ORY69460.1 hypothetical protein BCR38DRAFT_86036 [Pseudomassariella vexata]